MSKAGHAWDVVNQIHTALCRHRVARGTRLLTNKQVATLIEAAEEGSLDQAVEALKLELIEAQLIDFAGGSR